MKAIITDLDYTFWQGVLIENGTQVKIYQRYANFLKELQTEGILIGVASRNDFGLVEEALKDFDFFPIETSLYGNKSLLVSNILYAWNILPEDVLYIDDNVFEIREICSKFPSMKYLIFDGDNEKETVEMLRNECFPKKEVSTEDKLRRESIKAGVRFNREMVETGDTEEFFGSLNAEIVVCEEWTPRAIDLINKTHQFNINDLKLTEDDIEIAKLFTDVKCVTFSYTDKFGSLGTVGVAIVTKFTNSCWLHSFCLSCRAFGRRIEHQMLNYLNTKYGPININNIDLHDTGKNQAALDFFKEISCTKLHHKVICTKTVK